MRKAKAANVLLCVLASSISIIGAEQLKPGASRDSVQSYLNRTADAVLALKSTRFSIKREGTPAVLDEKNGITFTTCDCTYSAPDRVSCNVKVALKNGTILQLTRVWVPEGTFQSNPLTRQFGKAPADSNFNGVVLFAKTGVPEILRTAVQKVQAAAFPLFKELFRSRASTSTGSRRSDGKRGGVAADVRDEGDSP